jgi:DNA ligase (NAD+)
MHKFLPLHVFIGSLGIPLCARSVAKMIVDAGFDSLDKMRAATVSDIEKIDKLGSTKAAAFVSGLKAKGPLIDKLLINGVRLKAKSVGAMTGKSVCMTGFRSPEMELAVEDAGGTIKGSVGKGLTYLVCADPGSGSGKLTKAASLGVTVIGIEDMWALLGGKPGNATTASVPFAPKTVAPKPAPKVVDTSGDILDVFGE